MSMHPPEDPIVFKEMKGIGVIALFFVHGVAKLMHTVTRVPGSCGVNHFEFQAFGGWFLFSLYASCMPPAPGWEYVFGAYYVFPCLFLMHRILSAIQRSRGRVVHTRFVGESWLNKLFPFLGRDFTRGFLESVVCGLLGYAIFQVSPVLGLAFVGGGFAVFISHAMITDRDNRRVREMQDQALESQALADQFRTQYRSHS